MSLDQHRANFTARSMDPFPPSITYDEEEVSYIIVGRPFIL